MLLNKRIPLLYIFNKVKFELVCVMMLSVFVLVFTDMYDYILPEMPLTIPAFIGTAISILLSFKLNQSYDRWWEARKVWGSIVNDSRSLVMQLLTLTHQPDKQIIKKIAYRQMAWCYALGQSLRGTIGEHTLKNFITHDELAALNECPNKPLALLQWQGSDVKLLKEKQQLETLTHIQIDATLVRLCDAQGKAERIKGTVFPVTYRLFLHFMIYLFVATLSISLTNVAGYFEIPLLVIISTLFFLLEKSATHMQDPFENKPTDTAVTAIARTIEINIKQLLQEKDLPQALTSDTFYQL